MTFIQATRTCLRKYFDFTGRATRSEFWWFFLFTILVGMLTGLANEVGMLPSFLESLLVLALWIPGFAVATRRLHDTNRSGWWQLLHLLPLIGTLILIFWFIQRSDQANRFGPAP
jgi:uncharacterized membrane protein YhaH (DUF805 family)